MTVTYDLCADQGFPRVPQCHMSQKTKSRGAGLEEVIRDSMLVKTGEADREGGEDF